VTDHDALASSLALRLGACSMLELRAIDLAMRALEAKRTPAVDPELDESHAWDRDAHLTRVSNEPTLLALRRRIEGLMQHIVNIETQLQRDEVGHPTGCFRYRWRCSCGCKPGPWHSSGTDNGHHEPSVRCASTGGARHVAAMERAK
jgi:hypothetical protein